jgi:hypothetical protein
MVIRLTLLFRVVAVGRLILKLIGESWLEIPVRMAEPQSLNIRTDIKFSRNKTRVGCSFFKKIFGGVIAILYESTLPLLPHACKSSIYIPALLVASRGRGETFRFQLRTEISAGRCWVFAENFLAPPVVSTAVGEIWAKMDLIELILWLKEYSREPDEAEGIWRVDEE